VRYPSLDVELDDGVDGQVESIAGGRVVVVGGWSDGAGLTLRPDCPVVVLTRATYNELINRAAAIREATR
jgi:hypothetical protein